MIPKNCYKIIEDLLSKKRKNSIVGKSYKLTIVKRFDFSSKFQSNSVIVYNNLDESHRFFIKGAPEKIINICDPSSLPENFNEEFLNYTQNGYRVIACASKPINYDHQSNSNDREKFENNLLFLGFIIFKNKLKRDTKKIIGKLKDGNCKLFIATGDNPFTSISVARECKMIDDKQDIYFCNLENDNKKKTDILKWYNIKIFPNNKNNFNEKFILEKIKKENIINNINHETMNRKKIIGNDLILNKMKPIVIQTDIFWKMMKNQKLIYLKSKIIIKLI